MFRVIPIFLLMILGLSPVLEAQDCYLKLRNEGLTSFRQGNYDQAIRKYNAAFLCRPLPANNDLAVLLDRAFTARFDELNQAKNRAEQQTLTVAANDLAFKAEVAMRNGNLSTAFRLAEIAYNLVDSTNVNVNNIISEILFYNEQLSGTKNREQLLWNKTLIGNKFHVVDATFSSDGKFLAVLTSKGIWEKKNTIYHEEIVIWKIPEGEILNRFYCSNRIGGYGYKISFAPNSDELMLASDSGISVFDFHSGEKTGEVYKEHGQDVKWSDFCFNSDGSKLIGISDRGFVQFWDLKSGNSETLAKYSSSIANVFLSPDAEIFALVSDKNNLEIRKTANGKVLHQIAGETNDHEIRAYCFSEDLRQVAIAYQGYGVSAFRIDADTAQLVNTIEAEDLRWFSLSAGWEYLSIATNVETKIFRLSTDFTILLELKLEDNPLNTFFSPLNEFIFSEDKECSIKMWSLSDLNFTQVIQAGERNIFITSFDLYQDSTRIILGLSDGSIRTRSLQNSDYELVESSGSRVHNVALSPNQKDVVASFENDSLTVISAQKETTTALSELPVSIMYTPDGQSIVSAVNDGIITFVDSYSLDTIAVFEETGSLPDLYDFDISQDGKYLATAMGSAGVNIWDIQGEEKTINLFWEDNFAESVHFSNNGKYLGVAGEISGASENGAQIWDVEAGLLWRTLEGQWDDIAFHPNGEYCATSNEAGLIAIWDFAEQKIFRTIQEPYGVRELSFTIDGDNIVILTGYGFVRYWPISLMEIVRSASQDDHIGFLTPQNWFDYDLENLLQSIGIEWSTLLQIEDEQYLFSLLEYYSALAEGSNLYSVYTENYQKAHDLLIRLEQISKNPLYHRENGEMFSRWSLKLLLSGDVQGAVLKAKEAYEFGGDNLERLYTYLRARTATDHEQALLDEWLELCFRWKGVADYVNRWVYYPKLSAVPEWRENFEILTRVLNKRHRDTLDSNYVSRELLSNLRYNDLSFSSLIHQFGNPQLAAKCRLLYLIEDDKWNDMQRDNERWQLHDSIFSLFEFAYLGSRQAFEQLGDKDYVEKKYDFYEVQRDLARTSKRGRYRIGSNTHHSVSKRDQHLLWSAVLTTIEQVMEFAITTDPHQDAVAQALGRTYTLIEKVLVYDPESPLKHYLPLINLLLDVPFQEFPELRNKDRSIIEFVLNLSRLDLSMLEDTKEGQVKDYLLHLAHQVSVSGSREEVTPLLMDYMGKETGSYPDLFFETLKILTDRLENETPSRHWPFLKYMASQRMEKGIISSETLDELTPLEIGQFFSDFFIYNQAQKTNYEWSDRDDYGLDSVFSNGLFALAENLSYQEVAPSERVAFSKECNSLGWNALLNREFEIGEKYIRLGVALNDTYDVLFTNLPPALLFQGKYQEARELYLEWKDKTCYNCSGIDSTFGEVFLKDFGEFASKSVIPAEHRNEVYEIIKLLDH